MSKKQDPFLDLSLDIPDKYLPKHLSSRRSKEPLEQDSPACNIFGKLNLEGDSFKNFVNLFHFYTFTFLLDCLSSFIEVEELAESEQYYCNNCKDKQRSTKRFWIRRLPNVSVMFLCFVNVCERRVKRINE